MHLKKFVGTLAIVLVPSLLPRVLNSFFELIIDNL